MTDIIVNEVRRVREEIMAECGNDLKTLFKMLRKSKGNTVKLKRRNKVICRSSVNVAKSSP